MRKLAVIIAIICSLAFPLKGQAISTATVNFDPATIGLMTAYTIMHYVPESQSSSSISKIVNSYVGAEIALAGIYDNKKKDRRAMERPGLFSEEENWYFRMACSYAQRIMLKVVNVTYALLDHPDAILQWGPYIYGTITETRDLCKQFSALVTNGKLSFDTQDILWIVIGDDLEKIFQLISLADYDWKGFIDNLTSDLDSLASEITVEDITEGMKSIFSTGQNVANAGLELMQDFITQGTSAGKKLSSKPKQLIKGVKEIYNLYETITDPSKIKSLFLSKLGLSEPIDKKEAIKKIFKIKDFDISDIITDYNKPDTARYFTQTWHIMAKKDSSEIVCNFEPTWPVGESFSLTEILEHPEWSLFSDRIVLNGPLYLSDKELEEVLQKAETVAGWSREKCKNLSKTPDILYFFMPSLTTTAYMGPHYHWGIGAEWAKSWAASYSIKVVKETHISKEVYSGRVDTRNENYEAFEKKMNTRLESLQMSDTEGYTYVMVKDKPNYYDTADPEKLERCTSVTFKAHCSDGGNMGEGSFDWKSNPAFRHDNLNSNDARKQAIEQAMETNVKPSEIDTEEIDGRISNVTDSITDLTRQKKELEKKNDDLYAEIARSELQSSQIAQYKEQISANNEKIAAIKKEIKFNEQRLSEYYDLKEQIKEDYYGKEDVTRIPSKMRDIEQLYQLKWLDDGEWNGLTFTRKAKVSTTDKTNYILTFRAELSQTRQESRFLGIRYHRAILQVKWTLDANIESESIVDVINLDESLDKEKKEEIVNNRLTQLLDEFQTCTIKLEYNYPPEEEEPDDDVIHLLWPNERLEIERDIVSRLNTIYVRLLAVEKYIYQSSVLRDWLRMQLTVPRPAKRGNKADSCFREWYDRSLEHSISKKYNN